MVNVDAFKAHMKGMTAPEPAKEVAPEPDQDDAGLSPGEQAMKAIAAKDSTALEEAIRRCMDSKY